MNKVHRNYTNIYFDTWKFILWQIEIHCSCVCKWLFYSWYF